jgi:hypothetical protein
MFFMSGFWRRLTLAFAAGCMGGLVNSLALWLFGRAGIPAELGVKLAPALTPQWLYPRLVWGGIWGFLFVLPIFRNNPTAQGLFFSLWPSIVQLFIVFPYQANQGLMGLDLGSLTPVFVLFFNAVWGLTAAFWLRMVGKN